MVSTSEIILHSLIKNQEFVKKVSPHLKKEHFKRKSEKILFNHIDNYIVKYNQSPSFEVLYVELTNDNTIPENEYKEIDSLLVNLKGISDEHSFDWLFDTTEAYVKNREIEDAMTEAFSIIGGSDKTRSVGIIPELLTKALGVSFRSALGHDYLRDYELRYDHYHRKEFKTPFDIPILNDITGNGVTTKTLNLLVAGTHGGKSAMLCHFAAKYLEAGKNVLYISLEMNEMSGIGQRIDANLFDIPYGDIVKMPKAAFDKEIFRLRKATQGALKIVERPGGTIHSGNIKQIINDYLLKEQFKTDVLIVDYLGLLSCYRMRSMDNSYMYYKLVAEELRALGQEFDIPVWSAVQFNRAGFADSAPNLDKISDSFGVAMTADLALALVSSDELIQKQQILISQLKNRYDDMNKIPKFILGFDRSKFRFYDLNFKAQPSVTSQPFFNNPISEEETEFDTFKSMLEVETNKDKYSDLNF